jgi:ATP-dependent protease Clp ATPase subunit
MTKKTNTPPVCSFCAKPHDEVEILIQGRTNAYICNNCVTLCQSCIDDRGPQPLPPVMTKKTKTKLVCNFCGKPHDGEWIKILGQGNENGAYICNNCVTLCACVVEEREFRSEPPPLPPVGDVGSIPVSKPSLSVS